MWRSFIGWGVALFIGGIIVAIVAGSRTFTLDYETYSASASSAAAVFAIIGWLAAIIGGMLLNAGLIGAAVGADPRTHARDPETGGPYWPGSAVNSGASMEQAGYTRAQSSRTQVQTTTVPGVRFSSVDGSGFVFVGEDGGSFAIGGSGLGGMQQTEYSAKQLDSVEIREDGKVLVEAYAGVDAMDALRKAASEEPAEVLQSLAVVLRLAGEQSMEYPIWLHRGCLMDTSSVAYQSAWREASQCFLATASLLRSQGSIHEPAHAEANQSGDDLPQLRKCPRCGHVAEPGEGYDFCGYCGQDMRV